MPGHAGTDRSGGCPGRLEGIPWTRTSASARSPGSRSASTGASCSSSRCWPGSWPASCSPTTSQVTLWRSTGSPGTVTTVLFFGSLLAHEAAHALVAKRHGIAVRSITLWLFGGVSELEGEALTPGVEFRVAVVGPLTSFGVALVAGGCSILLHDGSGTTPVVAAALGWLAWINILLGGFNLMPAAPLDGGRILRAVLWHRSGDRVRATTTSSRCGEAFGYALVVLGVLECLTVGLLGLWFVFLGWFLLSAARAEQTDVLLRASLGDVRVRRSHDGRPGHLPGDGHRSGADRRAAPPLPLQHVSPGGPRRPARRPLHVESDPPRTAGPPGDDPAGRHRRPARARPGGFAGRAGGRRCCNACRPRPTDGPWSSTAAAAWSASCHPATWPATSRWRCWASAVGPPTGR